MKFFPGAAAIVFLGLISLGPIEASAADAPRTWTTTEGRVFQASLIKLDGTQVTLRLPTGQTAFIALARLSPADQVFIQQAGAAPSAAAAAPSLMPPARPPVGQRIWPKVVEVDARDLEIKTVSEAPAEQKCVYRSQNFEFTSQDKLAGSVIKEVARTFEATHALVQALPWSVDPKPPTDRGFYQAKLFTTRQNYIADGGPPTSGGVYFSEDRIFRVPFESLGLQLRGKTWFKQTTGYSGATIVHEVTHQMMHDFLPYLPIWVVEGTAEYAAMTPYNAGKFMPASQERGFKEYLHEAEQRGGITPAAMDNAMAHMQLTRSQWNQASTSSTAQHRLYVSSAMLVYYFCHLDGDGKGTRFLKYLDSIAAARDAWSAFLSDPRVHLRANGGFTYPSDLPLPAQARSETYGLEQEKILLDGRDAAQLQKDVSEGFHKIGIQIGH